MDNEYWLRYGVIALGVVGFLAIMALALSAGGGEIEGRSWVVQEMTADGVKVQPIGSVVPVANFVEGTVSGVAGCNSYSGSYAIGGDAITIGPLAATLMFCEQPEGAMEQEALYLRLLQEADTYRVSDDTLTLLEGETVLIDFTVLEAQQLDT